MNHILMKAIAKYGKQHQTIRAMEELAELIQALAKGNIEMITEEIADVEIVLDQLKYMYDIDPEPIKEFKLKRLNDRLGGS